MGGGTSELDQARVILTTPHLYKKIALAAVKQWQWCLLTARPLFIPLLSLKKILESLQKPFLISFWNAEGGRNMPIPRNIPISAKIMPPPPKKKKDVFPLTPFCSSCTLLCHILFFFHLIYILPLIFPLFSLLLPFSVIVSSFFSSSCTYFLSLLIQLITPPPLLWTKCQIFFA